MAPKVEKVDSSVADALNAFTETFYTQIQDLPRFIKDGAVIAAGKTKVTICYGTQTRTAKGFAKVKTKP
ncbi:putative cytochrome P450 [Corchorus olitorius]|uniref:Cytochrome P450 n=1 Tax=Corchorus olitorius TaxID=93759 RepID=A0A1R3HTD4_9ROSI|nr:putative cytochrome P450 [Corchorus olitorius]